MSPNCSFCLLLVGMGWLAALDAPNPSTRTRGPRPRQAPLPQDAVEQMLALADVRPDEVVVDPDCGDGRIVVTAARNHCSTCVGFARNPEHACLALDNVKAQQVQGAVCIVEAPLFQMDLRNIDVVAVSQLPEAGDQLVAQLMRMKPGARVVSSVNALPGLVPDKVVTWQSQDNQRKLTFYLWRAPFRKGS